jgi:hypothetical protein
MANRFTITEKWNDPWFCELPPFSKLLFLYLCDNCDIAGFWEINIRKAAFDTGMSANTIKGAFKELSRGLVIKGDWIWIKNFIKHQKNIPLNVNNKAHRGIIKRINDRPEFIDHTDGIKGASEPLARGTGIGIGEVNHISLRGCRGIDYIEQLDTPEFREALENWINHKKERHERLTDVAIVMIQKNLQCHGVEKAIEMIENSIANNWKTINEPFTNGKEEPEEKPEDKHAL